MSKKKRFGVSIPIELAEELDELSKCLNCDRSRIVVAALKPYVHAHLHYMEPHICKGVLIAFSSGKIGKSVNLIEKYKDIVQGYLHSHIDNNCVEVYIIKGPSEEIRKLDSDLRKEGKEVRYIPITHQA
ncbi:MAG: ribbon-helix-helix domain-containing protein [Staphylothermus sp.]|nr:ribbon-helix-helix domain-containing protein [Staphylothermus sp.]